MKTLVRLALVALCVLAAVAAGRALRIAPPEPAAASSAPKLMVRIASRDLPAGTFLDATKAPFAEWAGPASDSFVEQGAPPERDVLGAVIIAPIAAGQPVPRDKLLLPGQDGFLAAALAPGMRASSVAVDAVSGNAGLIFPGDRVDLILTQTLAAESGGESLAQRWASETILENVRVIAVDQNLASDPTRRNAAQAEVARTITLEVNPRDAEKVALASGLGRLSLSLRSLLVDGQGQAGGSADPAPVAARGPTWASDVSAVIRGASGRAEPRAAEPAARALAAEPARPRVRVFRGSKRDEPASP
jgi:pilus assembly protein CpaB